MKYKQIVFYLLIGKQKKKWEKDDYSICKLFEKIKNFKAI